MVYRIRTIVNEADCDAFAGDVSRPNSCHVDIVMRSKGVVLERNRLNNLIGIDTKILARFGYSRKFFVIRPEKERSRFGERKTMSTFSVPQRQRPFESQMRFLRVTSYASYDLRLSVANSVTDTPLSSNLPDCRPASPQKCHVCIATYTPLVSVSHDRFLNSYTA